MNEYELVDVALDERGALYLAAKILCLCAIAPAVLSWAFGLAGRGAIRESQGRVIGTSMCTIGMLVSLVAMFIAFWDANPFGGGRVSQYDKAAKRLSVRRTELAQEGTPARRYEEGARFTLYSTDVPDLVRQWPVSRYKLIQGGKVTGTITSRNQVEPGEAEEQLKLTDIVESVGGGEKTTYTTLCRQERLLAPVLVTAQGGFSMTARFHPQRVEGQFEKAGSTENSVETSAFEHSVSASVVPNTAIPRLVAMMPEVPGTEWRFDVFDVVLCSIRKGTVLRCVAVNTDLDLSQWVSNVSRFEEFTAEDDAPAHYWVQDGVLVKARMRNGDEWVIIKE